MLSRARDRDHFTSAGSERQDMQAYEPEEKRNPTLTADRHPCQVLYNNKTRVADKSETLRPGRLPGTILWERMKCSWALRHTPCRQVAGLR